MKKMMMLLLAMLSMSLSVHAQKMSKQQQESAMMNLFARATLVNGKFAITREPITYYDYWAATGEKAHGPNTSVTNAAIVSDGKKQKMVNSINKYFGETIVSLASSSQITEAQKKIGLHRELGENSIAGQGFFLVMTAEKYKKYKKMYDDYRKGKSSSSRSTSSSKKKNGARSTFSSGQKRKLSF